MDQAVHNTIVCFIWGIADDVLRDFFRRGKYPGKFVPMYVIRRTDALFEPTKRKVLDDKKILGDVYPSRALYFMFSNPPYGRTWKSNLEGTVTGRLE